MQNLIKFLIEQGLESHTIDIKNGASTLILNDIDWDALTANYLNKMISEFPQISTLYVVEEDIDDEKTILIAEFLKVNATIYSLNLSSNEITQCGIERIADALKENTILDTL